MSGIYGIICFIGGTVFGLSIYHFCIKMAFKMGYQSSSGEMPGKDTGQIKQEYSE